MRTVKVLIGLVVLFAALFAGTIATGIWRPWIPRESTPTAVATLGPPGDPDVVMVVFPWAEDGICPGQFSVSAEETATRVTVSQVSNREPAFLLERSCAGVGTDGVSAATELRLAAPLGDRQVVRAVDGQALPIR